MNRYLCNFAQGEQYLEIQQKQNLFMADHFKQIMNYNDQSLKELGFDDLPNALYIRENSNTGYGYCSWKPFIILDAMKHVEVGDIIFYLDVADYVHNSDFYNFVQSICEQLPQKSFFTINHWRHGNWTTKKCQKLMNCDTPEYYNKNQLEAGTLAFVKTRENTCFLTEWLMWCLTPDAICKDRNSYKQENEPTFVDHRTDQAILTNMFYKKNLIGTHIQIVQQFIFYNQLEKGVVDLGNKHKYKQKLDKKK